MAPKKILHVIRPAEGGMKDHLVTLSGGLREKGYQVEVACPPNSVLSSEIEKLGLAVRPINLVGPLSPGNDWVCLNQLQAMMRSGRYDIVHFHGSKAGLLGRTAAVLARCKKTVQTVHNFVVYEEVPVARKILYRSGENLLSRVTSKIITVSEALKEDLVKHYKIKPEKIKVIYNGIEPPGPESFDKTSCRVRFGIKPGTVVIGTIARMAPQKGLNYLIEAVPLIEAALMESEEPVDISFIIAGDGPLRPGLEELAGKLGVTDKVLFPGFIDNIWETLSCFDIFVTPSIAEGLSITTIQAMAAGLPVAASRVGGLPEVVREGVTGFLVRPRGSVELAQAVVRLVTDRETRQQFGSNGRSFAVERFSNIQMINETAGIYEQILGL